jgi:hypothetical protein
MGSSSEREMELSLAADVESAAADREIRFAQRPDCCPWGQLFRQSWADFL